MARSKPPSAAAKVASVKPGAAWVERGVGAEVKRGGAGAGIGIGRHDAGRAPGPRRHRHVLPDGPTADDEDAQVLDAPAAAERDREGLGQRRLGVGHG